MFELRKINEESFENDIFCCNDKSNKNINIVVFIKYLQSLGYVIDKVGIGNNSDMYERTLMPEYKLDDFATCYNNIISSPEYTRTQINIKYNGDGVIIYVKDNNIQVISYDNPVYLEDILKKKDHSIKF